MIEEASCVLFFFFQAEDGIRDLTVTGVQTCALPISGAAAQLVVDAPALVALGGDDAQAAGGLDLLVQALPLVLQLLDAARLLVVGRSEEHTSELQSQSNLVCRLLLEKKNTKHEHTRA